MPYSEKLGLLLCLIGVFGMLVFHVPRLRPVTLRSVCFGLAVALTLLGLLIAWPLYAGLRIR